MVNTTLLAKVQKALKIRYKILAIEEGGGQALDENQIHENEEAVIEILNKKANLSGCWLFHQGFEAMDEVYKSKTDFSKRDHSKALA